MTLAVIVPTRGRPEAAEALINEFYDKYSGYATLVFGVDDDDPKLGEYQTVFANDFPGDYVIGPRLRMCGTLNAIAVDVAKKFNYIGFCGDDHRTRTYDWDTKIVQALDELGTGIVYGDDLIWGEGLPTAVFMTADIVETLGYMAPPTLQHLYLDNFWLDLGNEVERLKYMSNVVIEHLHPSVGKAEWTAEYKEVNDPALYDRDRKAYERYLETKFEEDVEKVKKLCQKTK